MRQKKTKDHVKTYKWR